MDEKEMVGFDNSMTEKSVGLAVVLSVFLIGIGVLYVGYWRGLAYFILSIVFCWTIIVPLVFWIVGIVDAYSSCREYNNRLMDKRC